jgi:hypothetical protein
MTEASSIASADMSRWTARRLIAAHVEAGFHAVRPFAPRQSAGRFQRGSRRNGDGFNPRANRSWLSRFHPVLFTIGFTRFTAIFVAAFSKDIASLGFRRAAPENPRSTLRTRPR